VYEVVSEQICESTPHILRGGVEYVLLRDRWNLRTRLVSLSVYTDTVDILTEMSTATRAVYCQPPKSDGSEINRETHESKHRCLWSFHLWPMFDECVIVITRL